MASQNTNQRYRNRRPRPQFNARNSHLSSPEHISVVPNPDIPRVDLANQRRPPLIRPIPVYPQQPAARQHSTSSEEAQFLDTQPTQLHCYYPEAFYIADHVPTRTPRELRQFKEHCRLQYQAQRNTLVLDLPFSRVHEITSNPLNFQNLLWKTHTTLTHFGITEEYQWIRRQIRIGIPDNTILRPAYKVFYPWNTDGWNVSHLPRNHQ